MSHFNQGSHGLSGFFVVMIGCLVQLVLSFNIDTIHPIVYEDPAAGKNAKESYFGYSLQFLFNQTDNDKNSSKWLLVGAPRANSTFPTHANLIEPGQVYRCLLALGKTTNINCQPLIVESEGNTYHKNLDWPLQYKDRKDNGWLGGAMAVNSPSAGRVAVCGYRWVNQISEDFMNGVCYWSNHQVSLTENFVKIRPLVNRRQQIGNGTYIFGYGQSGFSVHMALKKDEIGMVQEEMIIGAPGVFNWTGAVIRVSDAYFQSNPTPKPSRRKRQDTHEFGKTLVSNSTQIKGLEPNDYFGYSVHSGIFFNDGKLVYVSGAPRAAEMKGKVLLFDFLDDNEISQLNVRQELNGTQLGEYFGASILAVDLTRDGKAELLVGAPQHSLQPEMGGQQTGDEGIVYFYRSNRNGTHLEKRQALHGSRARDARFGTTMASAGDINGDGFNDVVIGAPYENGKGAIYLYLGDKDGIRHRDVTGYWQRIAAADFVFPLNNLKGFGISLAAADIDGNGYPDVAVGSFLSGHALVFRSSPVIQLMINKPNFVDNVRLIDQFKKDGSSVEIRVCSDFRSKINITEICVGYSFYFDAEYINQPRLILDVNGMTVNQPFNYTGILKNGYPSCKNFKLSLAKTHQNSQDFSRPATIRMTGKLLTVRPINGQCSRMTDEHLKKDAAGSRHILITGKQQPEIKDAFCAECPVIDETMLDQTGIISSNETSAAFTSECGEDNICNEDLEVTANFINHKELVVGSQNTISFEVRLVNRAEPSYRTTLEIKLPSYTNLKRTDLCQKPSFGFSEELIELMYSCQLRVNPLKRETEKMEFELDLTSLPSGGSDNLTVALEVRMKGSTASGRQTQYNLTIPLKTAIDVEILGNSVQEQQTYHRSNDTVELKDRITFKQFYEVRNVLPSAAQVEIEIVIPNNVLSTQGVTLHVIDHRSVEATQQGGLSNTTCSMPLQQSIDTQKFRESISSSPTVKIQPAFKFGLQANRTAFIDCFNTPNVSCVKYICSAFGPLSTKSPIRISLTGTLLLQNIFSIIEKKDVFILSSAARVIIRKPANFEQSSGHKPDVAIASTYFLPQGPPESLPVASWIIVLAVLAGIILLSLMVVGLQKMGFFERQRYPQDEGLVEETPTPGEENSKENSEDTETEQPNA